MKRILMMIALTVVTLGASAQLLYRISGRGLASPSYILGTYHLAPVSFVDSIPGLRQAMDECMQTYGELLTSQMANADSVALLQQAMMQPDGMTIDKLLSADEMARLNAYMQKLLGMDLNNPLLAQQMGRMSPVALSTNLSLLAFVKKNGVPSGFDEYFQKESLAHGKGVGGLESMSDQINSLFKSMTLERQKELLMCQVDNADLYDEMTDAIIRAFFAQDIDAIKEAMDITLNNRCDSTPEEEDVMINNRNANWVEKMPNLMMLRPTLFAVGAAHLPGEKGVLNLLRQAGYTVEGVVE